MSTRTAIRFSSIPLAITATLLAAALAFGGRDDVTHSKVWIYFIDRGEGSAAELATAVEAAPVTARSLERRRVRGTGRLTDIHDVPVSAAYVERVRVEGCVIRHRSKYLNAVSALATPDQVSHIRALPFVRKVTPVRTYRRSLPEQPLDGVSNAAGSGDELRVPAQLDYGPSAGQLNQINVIPLHEANYHGEGVIVGVFDTGFMLRHEAFQHLDVLAEWDFIFNDGNTENEPEDTSSLQHNHGTQVLSTIAGFKEGQLIGPAYAATYILAKTERRIEEVVGEEDDFVRALEWADSLGADIVSSSLGYYAWYDFSDLDGNTAVTTVACDIAVSKGITICTAAGNERYSSWGHIIAPADGDSVIAVGGVTDTGALAYFSSPGPTADGRIKPDVAAQGQSVTTVLATDSTAYTSTASGTSFSTPLVAGACALILQKNPEWGPMDVLEALREEASQSASPDNDLGWGIIDAHQSALHNPNTGINAVTLNVVLRGNDVTGEVFNGFSSSQIVDVVRNKLRVDGGYESSHAVRNSVVVPGSSLTSFEDRGVAGGVYDYVVRLSGGTGEELDAVRVEVQYGASLSQNAPNPFVTGMSAQTTIRYAVGGTPAAPGRAIPIDRYSEVLLEVYDVSGARVATLVDEIKSPGEYTVGWDGLSDRGSPVASGVYFYRLQAPGQVLTQKLVLIRR
jgi:subtilisin family serine protease